MDFRDRIVQRTLVNYFTDIYEPIFVEDSYAYRPKKSVKLACKKIDTLIKSGYIYILDADLSSYFDNISHSILIKQLAMNVNDIRVLDLIKKYLNQIEYKDNSLIIKEKGVKQGSILSPILSNIYLYSFDKSINRRGYRLIRYADDFIIMTKSKDELYKAYKITENILDMLELKLNKEKTRVINLNKGFGLKFLGNTFDNNGLNENVKTKLY
jgi:group II intron reverse transcriptase/maturase